MKRIILSICFISMAFSQGVIQQFEKGSINYSDQTISAIGIGFVPENVINAGQARRSALRIAKADALRQLIEIVNGVTLTSETVMSGAMLDDVIKTRVEGLIRGARQIGSPSYLSDTSVEVEYQVPMSSISEIMLPVPSLTAGALANPAVTGTAVSPPPAAGGITGLIIDARGVGLRPAMAPRVLDQNGNVIYGPGNYSREYAVTNGVAGYSKTLEAARADTRVQGNPLIVKCVASSGTNRADMVVSNADISKINSADRSFNILRDCRVLILLD